MKPSVTNHRQNCLFETRLSDQLNPKHELLKLAELLDWNYLDKEFSCIYLDNGLDGQPPNQFD